MGTLRSAVSGTRPYPPSLRRLEEVGGGKPPRTLSSQHRVLQVGGQEQRIGLRRHPRCSDDILCQRPPPDPESRFLVKLREEQPLPSIDLKKLSERESEQVEWKENVADIHDVVRTITAFANDFANLGGGYVVCGAKETQDVHGFKKMETVGLSSQRLKEVEGRVIDACRQYVEPPLAPRVEVLPADDPARRILVFIVPASKQAHSFRTKNDSGKFYVRIDHQTREARNGLMRELLVRKNALEPWDRRCHPDARVEDLDLLAMRDTFQRIGVWDSTKSIEDYLAPESSVSPMVPSLCIREPLTGVLRPRNYAVLLFAHNPQRFYPDLHAIFSHYPGVDRAEPFSERREVTGSLMSQIRSLLERLNTEAYMIIDKTDAEEPNLVKYPRKALHEAVVNALVHRDCEAHHPVRVTVFEDRVEVLSPGALPSSVDEDVFRQGRAMPVWRNQSLAWFLNKLQLAQAEGQGIATILRSMKEEGCPAPKFDLTATSVLCTMPAHPRHALMRQLQQAERAVLLGNYESAIEQLTELLNKDPFNFRVAELFCETHRAAGSSAEVLSFITRYKHQLDRFPPMAQLQIAESLLSVPDPQQQEATNLAKRLIRLATQSGVEEKAVHRLVLGLLSRQQSQDALDIIDRSLTDHPSWNDLATFRRLRGQALLDLALQCTQAAGDPKLTARLKRRAWDQCQEYLDEAERELRTALELGQKDGTPSTLIQEFEQVRNLRAHATKMRSTTTT